MELFLEFALDLFADEFLAAGFGEGEGAVGAAALLVEVPFCLVLTQLGDDAIHCRFDDLGLEFAFPDGEDTPSEGFEALCMTRDRTRKIKWLLLSTMERTFMCPKMVGGGRKKMEELKDALSKKDWGLQISEVIDENN